MTLFAAKLADTCARDCHRGGSLSATWTVSVASARLLRNSYPRRQAGRRWAAGNGALGFVVQGLVVDCGEAA